MATTVSSLNCPNCGGKIQLTAGTKSAYCPYCGSNLAIDNGEITMHVYNHTYDEAELRRIELEEEHRRQDRFDREQRERAAAEESRRLESEYASRKRKWRIALILSLVLVVVFVAVYDNVPQPIHDAIAIAGGSLVLFVWPALVIWRLIIFIKRPRKRK